MPDYPVARDTPINFTPAVMQWSMDGGTVQAHIPLAALSPILRHSTPKVSADITRTEMLMPHVNSMC